MELDRAQHSLNTNIFGCESYFMPMHDRLPYLKIHFGIIVNVRSIEVPLYLLLLWCAIINMIHVYVLCEFHSKCSFVLFSVVLLFFCLWSAQSLLAIRLNIFCILRELHFFSSVCLI